MLSGVRPKDAGRGVEHPRDRIPGRRLVRRRAAADGAVHRRRIARRGVAVTLGSLALVGLPSCLQPPRRFPRRQRKHRDIPQGAVVAASSSAVARCMRSHAGRISQPAAQRLPASPRAAPKMRIFARGVGAAMQPDEMSSGPPHDLPLPSRSALRTASISERGAALYSCSRYWMVRVLMPSISAARDVEPPVAFKVSMIA